jgi:hypothetical protein
MRKLLIALCAFAMLIPTIARAENRPAEVQSAALVLLFHDYCARFGHLTDSAEVEFQRLTKEFLQLPKDVRDKAVARQSKDLNMPDRQKAWPPYVCERLYDRFASGEFRDVLLGFKYSDHKSVTGDEPLYLVNSTSSPPKPSDDEKLTTDIHKLSTISRSAKQQFGLVSASVSGWHSSLDLKIGSRSADKADATAEQFCNQVFVDGYQLQLVGKWKVRVYLADDSVGAECVIR